MTTREHDPIFESLDRLAGMADADLVGDRMPDIQRRVRVARRRKGAGLVAAAAVLAVAGVGLSHGLAIEHTAPPVTHPTTTPHEITVNAHDFTNFDHLTADLDGDGIDDVVEVLVPKDVTGEDQLLQVTWGTGETTTATLPNTMETTLRDPVDLDSDGDRELILQGGGGDVAVGYVFLADTAALERVTTVDAAGNELALQTDADPTAWQTYLGTDGIYSYQLIDPTDTQRPAPVQVRDWSLAGNTLTQSATSASQCVTFQPTFVLGPC